MCAGAFVYVCAVHGAFILGEIAACWRSILTADSRFAAGCNGFPRAFRGLIITSLPFIHISRGFHPRPDGKSDLSLERPVHTLTDDWNSLYWHCWQLPGWSTPTVWTPPCFYLWPCPVSPRFFSPQCNALDVSTAARSSGTAHYFQRV